MIYCVIRKVNSHPLAHFNIWHSQDIFTFMAHINCISRMNFHIKYKIYFLCVSPDRLYIISRKNDLARVAVRARFSAATSRNSRGFIALVTPISLLIKYCDCCYFKYWNLSYLGFYYFLYILSYYFIFYIIF